MADDDVGGSNAGKSFLQRQYLHVPMWGWIIGGVAGLYVLSKLRGGSTAKKPTAQSGNNGNAPTPNIFFLPQGANPTQVQVPVGARNGNRTPPDYFNAAGQDLGQYQYGSSEISYLNQNIGKFGLTQAEVNDVQAAYQSMVSKVGRTQADTYHYSWIGKGNVQAIPRQPAQQNQIVTGLQ